MRVSELAKALNLSSKDLLTKLKELKISVKTPTATLDADSVNRIRKAFAANAAKKAIQAKSAATAKKTAAKRLSAAKAAAAAAPKPLPPVAAPVKPAAPALVKPAAAPVLPKPVQKAAAAVPSAAQKHPSAPAVGVLTPPKPKVEKTAAPAVAKTHPVEAAPAVVAPAASKTIEVRFPVSVKDLSAKMDVKANDLIKYLMQQKVFASIVHMLDEETAKKAAAAFNCEILPQPTLEEELIKAVEPDPAKSVSRAPIVTFMGHVDHGKTSLLDAIRQAKVAEGEAGGITQHIGAYEVLLEKGHVTFLDTPGHEAFTALRARGANVTDVVVLVVAADDGVMPQTVEAIDHAKAANVPIVVAINKMDKEEANPQKVKQQLSQHGLIGEDWGGKTIMVLVSARAKTGIDDLLEMLLLEAEVLQLKADPTVPAQGTVIEAKQTKDRGPVATLLVQQGTLKIGDPILVGHIVGRVRAMANDRGHRLKEAGPATPVEVLGLPQVPTAGDKFMVVAHEKLAKQVAEKRQERRQQVATTHPKRVTLEELHQKIAEGQLKELCLVVKADVQGSLEAITQSLMNLDLEESDVQFRILHQAAGDINESDIILAAASDAIVVGFHVGINPEVQVLAANEGVDVHIYQIIYELVGSIKAAIEGLLEPVIEETFLGRAEVRRVFQVGKVGQVAGCMVVKGSVRRDSTVRVIRGRERLYEGKIVNLKRVKDDAREVQEGFECGISLQDGPIFQNGDLIEAWELKKVARKLG